MSYLKKIEKLQIKLIEDGLDYLIIENVLDIFYLTGIDVSSGVLLIEKNKASFFVNSIYIEAARKSSLDLYLISETSPTTLIKKNAKVVVGFDKNCSYGDYERVLKQLKEHNIDFEIKGLDNPLKMQRSVKSQDEIEILKKAAKINFAGYQYVLSILKEGITEKEVALEYECFIRKNGAQALSFTPIVAFAKNSSMPHHKNSNQKLKKDDIVLLDLGAKLDGYNSDMTRTFVFGDFSPQVKKMYNLVLQAYALACSLCAPGVRVNSLDQKVREFFALHGVEDKFSHSLGHGVGLLVHEYPRIQSKEKNAYKLEEGNVITIEPGLYEQGVGGIRYEDTIVITKDGYENFYEGKL